MNIFKKLIRLLCICHNVSHMTMGFHNRIVNMQWKHHNGLPWWFQHNMTSSKENRWSCNAVCYTGQFHEQLCQTTVSRFLIKSQSESTDNCLRMDFLIRFWYSSLVQGVFLLLFFLKKKTSLLSTVIWYPGQTISLADSYLGIPLSIFTINITIGNKKKLKIV